MAQQRFTIKLKQLRCILESDPGPAEPYLWVTYFALGPQVPQFQTGPLAVNTPSFDAFRTEFPSMSAGDVVGIPPFIASASFDMDLDSAGPKLLGCVAVLMEEDDTRQSDIVFGRIAYSKEMEKQLNDLMRKRIQTGNDGPLTEAEKNAIKSAVKSKVEDAVGSHQGVFDIFRDQDDNLGFTHMILPDGSGKTIQAGTFDFPEIRTTKKVDRPFPLPDVEVVTDRFVLSGELTIGPVPGGTVDLCAAPRAALKAKRDEIKGLQHRVELLQLQLQQATPQQKPAIVQQIGATNALIGQAEAALPALEAALKACIDRFHTGLHDVVVGGVLTPN
jgi:hypothetical protein